MQKVPRYVLLVHSKLSYPILICWLQMYRIAAKVCCPCSGFNVDWNSYPSSLTACETKAWPQHKLSCKSLEVVEWTPFIISSEGPLGARFQTAVPRGAPVRASRANIVDANAIPPNTHGDNPFLIKVQYNTSPWMMVYDRARSMTVHLAKDDQRAGCWERLARLIEAKGFTPMYPRYKLYCWGKRTGDYEITISLDELPEQGLPW